MNIALCYESVMPSRGGCETYIADLARRLSADGHEVHLYACRWDESALPRGMHYHCVPTVTGPRFLRPWRFGRHCLDLLRANAHDVSLGFDKTWGQDVLYPQGGLHAASAEHNLAKHPASLARGLARVAKALDLAHWSFTLLERKQYLGARRPLVVVTGGPDVVRAAMSSGKRAICAGPGNPPAVVDETADIEKAAHDIVWGASTDNNIICTDEKEVICVAMVADRLKEAFARAGAVMLQPHQTEKLRGVLLEKEQGPRKYAVINRKYVGKSIHVILGEAGIPCDPAKRLAVCEVDNDHPFLWTEMMMPVLAMTRVKTCDDAIDFAVEVEHGYRHTASMHSRNMRRNATTPTSLLVMFSVVRSAIGPCVTHALMSWPSM